MSFNRQTEIRALLLLAATMLRERAGSRLQVFADCNDIHRQLAGDMADFIKQRNSRGEPIRFILPVGPVGQYPYFLEIIHREQISLKNCWFFYMDEYADADGNELPASHPLSFQGIMRRLWLDQVEKELAVPEEQLFFPGRDNINTLSAVIERIGGIDICFGGIGIHGHLAFNEPETGVKDSNPRLVKLNDFTVTINTVRSRVGGNLEGFPRHAYTLGLRQILGARRIKLACRNGIDLDWANTVLRLALLGTPGDDYPCTYITQHDNVVIYTDHDTLKQPEIVL